MFMCLSEVVQETDSDGVTVAKIYRVLVPISSVKMITEIKYENDSNFFRNHRARSRIIWFDGTEAKPMRVIETVGDIAQWYGA